MVSNEVTNMAYERPHQEHPSCSIIGEGTIDLKKQDVPAGPELVVMGKNLFEGLSRDSLSPAGVPYRSDESGDPLFPKASVVVTKPLGLPPRDKAFFDQIDRRESDTLND